MISDIDIKDWEKTEMKSQLWKIPRGTVVSTLCDAYEPFWFDHVDGAYSFCLRLNCEVFHPTAWTEVYVWSKKP